MIGLKNETSSASASVLILAQRWKSIFPLMPAFEKRELVVQHLGFKSFLTDLICPHTCPSGIGHSPSTGDTLPSAVRTKCVILVFLAFLFWLPTSISILVWPCMSGHIMAAGAHDLALETESSRLESLCTTAEGEEVRGGVTTRGFAQRWSWKSHLCCITSSQPDESTFHTVIIWKKYSQLFQSFGNFSWILFETLTWCTETVQWGKVSGFAGYIYSYIHMYTLDYKYFYVIHTHREKIRCKNVHSHHAITAQSEIWHLIPWKVQI